MVPDTLHRDARHDYTGRRATGRALLISLLLAVSATALYATRLTQAPRYLARDEVGFARQAYTFATTGRDLDGHAFPLFFGEPAYHVGRDPLLIYADAVLLKVFPLSDVIVRLPTALFGVLDVLLMFAVARRLFRSDALGATAAMLLALSPAHFMHSRLAVSLLLPLPFTLLWLLCLTVFLDARSETAGRRALSGAALSLGLGVYGYLASVLLMPVYLLCTVWIAAGKDTVRRIAVIAGAFAIAVSPLVIWELAHPTRFHEMIVHYHPYAPQFGPLQGVKEMLSYFSLSVRTSNYWTNISPSLLFLDGDASLINSTRLAGVFLWPFALLFVAGLYQIATTSRSRFSTALLIGFATAPLPQVLTVDVGIRRSLVLVVFAVLIAMYGVQALLARTRRLVVRAATVVVLLAVPVSFHSFYRDYVGDYQARAASWFGGNIRGMAEGLLALRPSPTPIYLSNKTPYLDEYWPYYAAMYGRQELLPDTHYYTPDEFNLRAPSSRTLLVAAVNEAPLPDRMREAHWALVCTITEPTGQPVFLIYEKQ